jgi:hypothetical protein
MLLLLRYVPLFAVANSAVKLSQQLFQTLFILLVELDLRSTYTLGYAF